MNLPNFDKVIVLQAKITEYLLALSHPDGHSKARFFINQGFSAEAWKVLAEVLVRHAAEQEVTKVEISPYGTRYILEGPIVTPEGQTPWIRVVWFVETGEEIPRLVTAYPSARR